MSVKSFKQLKLRSSVLSLQILEPYLIAIDNNYNIYMIENKKFELRQIKKAYSYEKPLHNFYKGFCISTAGDSNIPLIGSKKSVVLTISPDLNISKKGIVSWHREDIEIAEMSANAKLMATSGLDGKIFIFDLVRLKLLTSLPRQADYASSMVFSQNGDFLALNLFNKTTFVFDISRNIPYAEFACDDIVECCKFFSNDEMLMLCCRDGFSLIFDMAQKKIIEKSALFDAWPTSVDLSEDGKYAFIGKRNGYMSVVELNANRVLVDVKVGNKGITAISRSGELLITCFEDGVINILSIFKYKEEFSEAIGKGDYIKAKAILEQNRLLELIGTDKIFDDAWSSVLAEAKYMLSKNRAIDAQKIVGPFMQDTKRAEEFSFYIQNKNKLAAFDLMVEKKNYTEAFVLLENNKFLQELEATKVLEGHWQATFATAMRLMSENADANKKKVFDTMSPFFKAPSKKELAYNIVNNPKSFIIAEQFAKKKDFKGYYLHVAKNQFLKESELYEKVTLAAGKLLSSITTLEAQEKFDEAISLINTLAEFEPYSRAANERLMSIGAKKVFAKMVQDEKISEAYRLLEKEPSLKSLAAYAVLNNDFTDALDAATGYAFVANIELTKESFEKFANIPYLMDKISSVVKAAYLSEIQRYLPKKDELDWDRIFKEYVSMFGIDAEIEKIAFDIGLSKKLAELDEKELYRKVENMDRFGKTIVYAKPRAKG